MTAGYQQKGDSAVQKPRELTADGYDLVIWQIVNRCVEPPINEGLDYVRAWLVGYARCQNDIIDLIQGLQNGSKQRQEEQG